MELSAGGCQLAVGSRFFLKEGSEWHIFISAKVNLIFNNILITSLKAFSLSFLRLSLCF
jgi:hypothetical protein